MNYGWETVKIIFYLALVLGIIYIINYYLKNNLGGQKQGQHIKIIEKIYLAPKKCLNLVMVEDKVFLLSISENEVRLISEWKESEFSNYDCDLNKLDFTNSAKNFKDYMQEIIKGHRRDDNE